MHPITAELATQIANIAAELYGYSGKIVYKANPANDYLADNPNRRCPLINKAKHELGYKPSINLDEGLKRSLIWYYDNNTAEDA